MMNQEFQPISLKDFALVHELNYNNLRNNVIGKIEALYEGLKCPPIRQGGQKLVTEFGSKAILEYYDNPPKRTDLESRYGLKVSNTEVISDVQYPNTSSLTVRKGTDFDQSGINALAVSTSAGNAIANTQIIFSQIEQGLDRVTEFCHIVKTNADTELKEIQNQRDTVELKLETVKGTVQATKIHLARTEGKKQEASDGLQKSLLDLQSVLLSLQS